MSMTVPAVVTAMNTGRLSPLLLHRRPARGIDRHPAPWPPQCSRRRPGSHVPPTSEILARMIRSRNVPVPARYHVSSASGASTIPVLDRRARTASTDGLRTSQAPTSATAAPGHPTEGNGCVSSKPPRADIGRWQLPVWPPEPFAARIGHPGSASSARASSTTSARRLPTISAAWAGSEVIMRRPRPWRCRRAGGSHPRTAPVSRVQRRDLLFMRHAAAEEQSIGSTSPRDQLSVVSPPPPRRRSSSPPGM